ncbi:helix-turn-helix domain-containing protein [Ketobacter sp. MCCC 1A13808]|uniref:helix-turn-helix domain-containing protein n=1 Tax=Ketobacter sp. MCCC 1A13808 TaxID=2602738 RepID=UPI000F1134BF|nr:helix-turn-helix transcriptional regulator [Ketobacter sp. MCCC 1A13808]MVF11902.1 helix-turn-helix domain-containing protein [Ketobacter sp. MCCC 1A13808]RLP53083.1 MAG: XRE family transcriptional regulator [Ketobacter sp.]
MTTTIARPNQTQDFGSLLRGWRDRRKYSQLNLALEAGVSQRHLSFLESGRAQPSRGMILQLADALDIPLRDRNALLHVAGFAPAFQQRSLDNEDMAAVKKALEMTLAHHEPYPAIVMNSHWGILMQNQAAMNFIGLLGDSETLWRQVDPSGSRNAMRLIFHEQGMQPYIQNWDQVATFLLSRMQKEVAADPTHEALAALFDELCEHPNLPADWRNQTWNNMPPPILTMEIAFYETRLNMFSMLSSFGTALDITAATLCVETFFPADDETTEFFNRLSQ